MGGYLNISSGGLDGSLVPVEMYNRWAAMGDRRGMEHGGKCVVGGGGGGHGGFHDDAVPHERSFLAAFRLFSDWLRQPSLLLTVTPSDSALEEATIVNLLVSSTALLELEFK